MLFSDFLLQWLEIAKPTIALTTYASYSGMAKSVIIPYFKEREITLSELKATDIQAFYMKQLKRVSGFEVRLINAMSRERVLKTYVNEVKKNYDYVLIDCMPSLGMITINALAAADGVIIPTQPHYLSAKGLELLLRSVSMVKRQINPKLRIDGILMTMVMPRTNISKEITATVKSAYGQKIKVFDTEIPHSIRAVEATAEGKSIFAYDKSGKVAAAYEQFGKEVAEIGEKQRNQNQTDRLR